MIDARGIIIIAIKDKFPVLKNITKSKPINVRPSLKILNMPQITFLYLITSKFKFEIYLPECFLSIISVSALINDLSISVCNIFLTSSEH